MKPTHWIEINGGRVPEFFCPVCGKRLTELGGGGHESNEPPDAVTCTGCGFTDHIEW